MDAGPEECERAATVALEVCGAAGISAEDDVTSIASRWLRARGQLWTEEFAHVERILSDPSIPPDRKLEEMRMVESLAIIVSDAG